VTVKVIRNKIVENISWFAKIPLNQVIKFTVSPLEGVKVDR